MKYLKTISLVLLTAVAITSCHTGSHVIVASDDNNTNIKLEYWGTVTLNSSKTAITGISHGGFIDYKKNDEELHITKGVNGYLSYEINGKKTVALDAEGRGLLAEMVQGIAKVQAGH